jgi:DNA-binding response OmpR family regulator
MMPGMDGCTVCQRIRQVSDVPIIMLTAMNRENDIIRALDYGADDYVTKPFSHNVLLARTRAALRRARVSAPPKTPLVYYDNHLIIDRNKHRVFVDGQAVKLTAIEFRLLTYLFQNAGRVLNFRQILNNVWGEEYQGNTEYVHVYIQRLRRKVEIDPSSPTYILTEHGVGYRFEKSSD